MMKGVVTASGGKGPPGRRSRGAQDDRAQKWGTGGFRRDGSPSKRSSLEAPAR